MAFFNYKPLFAPMVEHGLKFTTIRAVRKRMPKRGEVLHHFTGMRTKTCRKLMTVPCLDVQFILITPKRIRLGSSWLSIDQSHAIARLDGFEDWDQMREWFRITHGLPFQGFLTLWDPKKAIRS